MSFIARNYYHKWRGGNRLVAEPYLWWEMAESIFLIYQKSKKKT
jgi:hypothetical protein